jgi:hypothetical protein
MKDKSRGEFYDWFMENDDPDNVFNPPMNAQTAVNMLVHYLLGEDWFSMDPVSTEQVNTEAIHDILQNYSPKFRKEKRKLVKEYRKELKNTESFIRKVFKWRADK